MRVANLELLSLLHDDVLTRLLNSLHDFRATRCDLTLDTGVSEDDLAVRELCIGELILLDDGSLSRIDDLLAARCHDDFLLLLLLANLNCLLLLLTLCILLENDDGLGLLIGILGDENLLWLLDLLLGDDVCLTLLIGGENVLGLWRRLNDRMTLDALHRLIGVLEDDGHGLNARVGLDGGCGLMLARW